MIFLQAADESIDCPRTTLNQLFSRQEMSENTMEQKAYNKPLFYCRNFNHLISTLITTNGGGLPFQNSVCWTHLQTQMANIAEQFFSGN